MSVLHKADHYARRPELFGSCGFPIAWCSVSLRDDDNEVKPGEAGEICVRAPHAMEQYWKRPAQTAETFITMVAVIGTRNGARPLRR